MLYTLFVLALVAAFFGVVAYAYNWDRKNPHK